MRRSAIILLLAGMAPMTVLPANAQRVAVSLSNHRVMVTSNFTGEELVLFGAVEPEGRSVPRRGGYDLIVTVTGPKQNVVTRRKDRVLGIWVNVESRAFEAVPAYLAALSNRALRDIANPEVLRRNQIGFDYVLLPQRIGADTADVVQADPFRQAFVRIKREQGLYREVANGVTFLTGTVFRANIVLPAGVPVGNYAIQVFLFADTALIARNETAFEVYKAGFEQFVANAAHTHGLLYGLATTLLALLTGWLGWLIFRRD